MKLVTVKYYDELFLATVEISNNKRALIKALFMDLRRFHKLFGVYDFSFMGFYSEHLEPEKLKTLRDFKKMVRDVISHLKYKEEDEDDEVSLSLKIREIKRGNTLY